MKCVFDSKRIEMGNRIRTLRREEWEVSQNLRRNWMYLLSQYPG